jgi:hypothetical protein
MITQQEIEEKIIELGSRVRCAVFEAVWHEEKFKFQKYYALPNNFWKKYSEASEFVETKIQEQVNKGNHYDANEYLRITIWLDDDSWISDSWEYNDFGASQFLQHHNCPEIPSFENFN